jgi:hypothetical protein
MDRPTKPSGRHAVRLRWDEIITRLSYRFIFLAIRDGRRNLPVFVTRFDSLRTGKIDAIGTTTQSEPKAWVIVSEALGVTSFVISAFRQLFALEGTLA